MCNCKPIAIATKLHLQIICKLYYTRLQVDVKPEFCICIYCENATRHKSMGSPFQPRLCFLSIMSGNYTLHPTKFSIYTK